MAVTIPRTPWIDDDGSGTSGTVINNAEKTLIYDQVDVALAQLEGLIPVDAGPGEPDATRATAVNTTLADSDLAVVATSTVTVSLPPIASIRNRTRSIANGGTGIVTVAGVAQNIYDRGVTKTTTKLGPGEVLSVCTLDANTYLVSGRNAFAVRAHITRSAVQTIPTSVTTKVLWDQKAFDLFAEVDLATNRFVAAEAMEVLAIATLSLQGVTGRAINMIYKNGAYVTLNSASAEGADWALCTTWQGALAPGEYLESYVRHDHGSDRPLYAGLANSSLSIRRTA
jgi:hypothetical protein